MQWGLAQHMVPSIKFSRAHRRVKMWKYSSVSGTGPVPTFRELKTGTEFVPKTLEKFHTLKRLSARKDFVECSSHVIFKTYVSFLGYESYETGFYCKLHNSYRPNVRGERSFLYEIQWNANLMQLVNFIDVFLARNISGGIRPSTGVLDVELQHMAFCTESLDRWWSWEPLRRSCVRCGWWFYWCIQHLILLMMDVFPLKCFELRIHH